MKLSDFLEKTSLSRNDLTIFHDVSEAIKMVKEDVELLSVVNGYRWTEDEYSSIYLAVSPFIYFLDPKKCSRDQYDRICRKAVKQRRSNVYDDIKTEYLSWKTRKRIYSLVSAHYHSESASEQLLTEERSLRPEQYAELCLKIVRRNGLFLQSVRKERLTTQKYIKICTAAVRNHGLALKYVDFNLCTMKKYKNICRMAIKNTYVAFIYVKKQTKELGLLYIRGYKYKPFKTKMYFKTLFFCEFLKRMLLIIFRKIPLKFPIEIGHHGTKVLSQREIDMLLTLVEPFDLINNEIWTPEFALKAIKSFKKSDPFPRIPGNRQTYKICRSMLRAKPELFNRIKGYVIKKFTDVQRNILFKAAGKYGEKAKEILFSDDYDSVLESIKQDPLLFQYVNEKYFSPKQYYDFCMTSVLLNGDMLEFVNTQTMELALAAVGNKVSVLKYINAEQFTQEEYFRICLTAAAKSEFPLRNILDNLLSNEQYEQICLSAVKVDSRIFEHIKPERISLEKYDEICLVAVKENGSFLKYVKPEKLSVEKYDKICVAAFKNKQEKNSYFEDGFFNDTLLKYVDSKKCSPVKYSEICIIAIELNVKKYDLIKVFNLIDTSKCTVEAYEKICINILKNGVLFFNFNFEKIDFCYLKNQALNVCLAAIEIYDYLFTKMYDIEFTNNDYFLLCSAVISKSGYLLPYVNAGKLTKDQYAEICILAVRQDKKSAKYVVANMFDD